MNIVNSLSLKYFTLFSSSVRAVKQFKVYLGLNEARVGMAEPKKCRQYDG